MVASDLGRNRRDRQHAVAAEANVARQGAQHARFPSIIGKDGCDQQCSSQIDRSGGEIEVDGQSWTARPYSSDVVIEQGTEIEVYEIDRSLLSSASTGNSLEKKEDRGARR